MRKFCTDITMSKYDPILDVNSSFNFRRIGSEKAQVHSCQINRSWYVVGFVLFKNIMLYKNKFDVA